VGMNSFLQFWQIREFGGLTGGRITRVDLYFIIISRIKRPLRPASVFAIDVM